jgi:hypothetical protein
MYTFKPTAAKVSLTSSDICSSGMLECSYLNNYKEVRNKKEKDYRSQKSIKYTTYIHPFDDNVKKEVKFQRQD